MGDMSSDLTVLDGGLARQATPTPRFPRIDDMPVRTQPGVESRDQDATGDCATAASKLLANHSTPSGDVSPDLAMDAKSSTNQERPVRAKHRPSWLEEFVAKLIRPAEPHSSHSMSRCHAVWTSPSISSSSSSTLTSSSQYYCCRIRDTLSVTERACRIRAMDRPSTSSTGTAASASVSPDTELVAIP